MLKHPDDDGDLSVFASGNEILFACSHGEYWLVEATQVSPGSSSRARSRTGGKVADAESLKVLTARFGPDLRAALGLGDDLSAR